MIVVTVEDRDPKRAADMANAFVEEMVAVSKGLAITEAAQRRLFFEEQLQDVKQALSRAEEGIREYQEKKGGNGHDPLMPTGRMPSVGMEYLRKLRDVKYNEILYELLAKQYEMAKLDEARDAVTIQVIDKAVIPEKKVKPKRAIIVALSTFTGLLFSIFTAFRIERGKTVFPSSS